MKRMLFCVTTVAIILMTSALMADKVFVKKNNQLLVAVVVDSITISPSCQQPTLTELTNILSGQTVMDTVNTYWKIIRGFPIIQSVDAMEISQLGLSEDGRKIIEVDRFTAENEPVNWYWATTLMWFCLIGLGILFSLMPAGPRNRLALLSFILTSSVLMAATMCSVSQPSSELPVYAWCGQIIIGAIAFFWIAKNPNGLYVALSAIGAIYYNSIVLILGMSASNTGDYSAAWGYTVLYCLILLIACGLRELHLRRARAVAQVV